MVGNFTSVTMPGPFPRFTIQNYATGKALDCKGESTSSGTPVIMYEFHGRANQCFEMDSDGCIYPLQTAIFCARNVLDVCGGVGFGYSIALYAKHGGANQKWNVTLRDNSVQGHHYIVLDHNHQYALTAHDDGRLTIENRVIGNRYQLWTLQNA